jgi:hypothetical protein
MLGAIVQAVSPLPPFLPFEAYWTDHSGELHGNEHGRWPLYRRPRSWIRLLYRPAIHRRTQPQRDEGKTGYHQLRRHHPRTGGSIR